VTLVEASDGLPAREVHVWSDEKLFYVERFMDIFTTGMKNRWERLVYADLFSGPGRTVEEGTGTESLGSPLRALQFREFAALFFNDGDEEAVRALRARTAHESPDRVRITNRDCDEAVEEAREFLFPRGAEQSTLGFAFIDPTAYQMRFESVQRLTAGLRWDLIITFMTSFPKRFIGQPGFDEGSDFDLFMGTREWLDLGGHRVAFGFTRELLDIYKGQLKTLEYEYVDDSIRVLNSKRSTIYHLIFASKHPRGADFFEKISQRDYRGQRRLL
jgi:three-Cys-motif partner protein